MKPTPIVPSELTKKTIALDQELSGLVEPIVTRIFQEAESSTNAAALGAYLACLSIATHALHVKVRAMLTICGVGSAGLTCVEEMEQSYAAEITKQFPHDKRASRRP